jgi:hypothetical protein
MVEFDFHRLLLYFPFSSGLIFLQSREEVYAAVFIFFVKQRPRGRRSGARLLLELAHEHLPGVSARKARSRFVRKV